MDIYNDLEFHMDLTAVSLGKFDGIHLGHRELLKRITSRPGLVPAVFTFGMSEASGRKYIYSQSEKDGLLAELGIKKEVVVNFEDIRKMSPEDFISKVLHDAMDARYISVGEDFKFGFNRAGDVDTLKKYAGKYGYTVESVRKSDISSTRIRNLVSHGDVAEAGKLLGYPYFFKGRVIHGEHMGNTIGFPTANLNIPDLRILPPSGAYASDTVIGEKVYLSITNIGNKPTAGSFNINAETHVLNFNDDIYGREIEVRLVKFMRPEKKFASFDELKAQLERDKEERMRF